MSRPDMLVSDQGETPAEGHNELGRLLEGARDALTDDIVSRLGSTAAESLDLLDRLTRSGIDEALPTIAAMVKNGDLQRVADLARLLGSAQDALTDEMISRLAQTAGDGLDLLDRVNRSGIGRALPAIAQLVDNGDLERIVGLARLLGSAQDALSDDIISRLALLAGELMCLVDRLARNPGFFRLLELLGRPAIQDTLVGLLEGIGQAREELREAPPSKGGISGLLQLAKDPGTQDALRLASAMGRRWRAPAE